MFILHALHFGCYGMLNFVLLEVGNANDMLAGDGMTNDCLERVLDVWLQ